MCYELKLILTRLTEKRRSITIRGARFSRSRWRGAIERFPSIDMAPGRILETIQELGGEEFLPPVGENDGDGNGAAYRPLVWEPNRALTHI